MLRGYSRSIGRDGTTLHSTPGRSRSSPEKLGSAQEELAASDDAGSADTTGDPTPSAGFDSDSDSDSADTTDEIPIVPSDLATTADIPSAPAVPAPAPAPALAPAVPAPAVPAAAAATATATAATAAAATATAATTTADIPSAPAVPGAGALVAPAAPVYLWLEEQCLFTQFSDRVKEISDLRGISSHTQPPVSEILSIETASAPVSGPFAITNEAVVFKARALNANEVIESRLDMSDTAKIILRQDSSGKVCDHSTGLDCGQQSIAALKQARMMLVNYRPEFGALIIRCANPTEKNKQMANKVCAALLLLTQSDPHLNKVVIQTEVEGCLVPGYLGKSNFINKHLQTLIPAPILKKTREQMAEISKERFQERTWTDGLFGRSSALQVTEAQKDNMSELTFS